jgi:ABC-type arginine transport system permease subunit
LIHAVLLFGYTFLALPYLNLMLLQYNSIHFTPWILVSTYPFIYMFLGILLGLDHLIGQVQHKDGRWSADATRLIILGLPALYFSCYLLMYFGNIRVLFFRSLLFQHDVQQFFNIAAVIFGYILITSFHKTTIVNVQSYEAGGAPYDEKPLRCER